MVSAAPINGIRFDPERHVYTLTDGTRVPSVRQILRETGISVDFTVLPGQDAIALKRDIGTAVHAEPNERDTGVEYERGRVRGILNACRAGRLSQAFADSLIAEGVTLESA